MKRASNSPAHPLHNQLDANSSFVFYMCLFTLHITRISDSTLQGDNKLELFKDMHHDLKLEEADTRTGTDKAH
jgi:hypothetical protein